MREEDYKKFCEDVLTSVTQAITNTSIGIAEVILTETSKMNDPEAKSIVAKYDKDTNIAPSIYLTPLYEEYKEGTASMGEITYRLIDSFVEARNTKVSFEATTITPENAREHLYLQVVNRDNNLELAKECAHYDIPGTDLMAIPRWRVDMGNDTIGSIIVKHELQTKMLKMTDEEVLNIARDNTLRNETYSIKGMSEVMRQMMAKEMPEELIAEMMPLMDGPEQMYVLGNETGLGGASALLSKETLMAARERIEEDFYIIPSSLSEVLCVPKSTVRNPADLQEMCRDVNRTQVALDEQLGDNIFYCDGKKLHICNSLEELRDIEELMEENLSEGFSESVHMGVKM